MITIEMQLPFRNLFVRRAPARASEEKASRTGAIVALFSQGRPRWTPRDYHALAREGYAKNPIAFRSVRMIAEAAANVRLLLYEGAREHDEHPLLALLAKPNPRQTGADLIEQLAGYLLVSGNAYLERVSLLDEVRELHALRPDRMKVIPGSEGWAEAYEYRAGGSSVRFSMSETPAPILHLTLFNPLDDHYGMSPLEAAQASLDVHNAASAWNKALLDNAARPSGALVYSAAGGNLSDEQFERLKSELEAHYQGAANAGRPLLLEGGLDWKGLSLSPKDMDFVEAKHIAAREIALSFGVPPMLLGIPGDNTYSNYAEANRAFYRQTVVPLVSRIASALGHWLGESFGGNLRLAPDLDEVPALSIEREALWKRVGEAAFLTDDEKRAAAGYEPLPASSLTTLLAKYSPDQPRVPAGNPDGGQWTSGGEGGGSAANSDEGRVLSDENPDDEWNSNEQYANLRRGSLVHRLPNGQFVIVPPHQAATLQAAQNRADALTREVRDRDPSWRPEVIATSMSVEGEIARYESRAEQARARLEELRLGIGGNYGPPINPMGFRTESWQPLRSNDGPRLIEAYIAANPNRDLLGDSAWSLQENTVAVTTFNGSLIFGVNSTAPTALHQDRASADRVREVLLEKYPSELSTNNIGRFPNNALYHAEATILLRAARANGGTLAGQYLEIHVNQTVCPHCEKVLPILTRELGFPTVKFIQPSGKTKLLRNGRWE